MEFVKKLSEILVEKEKSWLEFLTEVVGLGLLLGYFCYGFFYKQFMIHEAKLLLFYLYLFYVLIFLPIRILYFKNVASFKLSLMLALLLRFFYNIINWGRKDKELKIFENEKEKISFLFFVIRLIFIPAMLNFFVEYLILLVDYISLPTFSLSLLITKNYFFVFLSAIYVVTDTFIFSFGYIVEDKKFNNSIKSVDKTVLGWIAALACYFPFILLTIKLLPMYAMTPELAVENTFFISERITTILFVLILIMYFANLSSTISLGAKCSNLTNRGIVTRGAFKIVRHPAYSSKIISWWLLTLPFMSMKVFIAMIAWTIIYILRAYTEEKHLEKDSDYLKYRKKTKWLFVPYLI